MNLPLENVRDPFYSFSNIDFFIGFNIYVALHIVWCCHWENLKRLTPSSEIYSFVHKLHCWLPLTVFLYSDHPQARVFSRGKHGLLSISHLFLLLLKYVVILVQAISLYFLIPILHIIEIESISVCQLLILVVLSLGLSLNFSFIIIFRVVLVRIFNSLIFYEPTSDILVFLFLFVSLLLFC